MKHSIILTCYILYSISPTHLYACISSTHCYVLLRLVQHLDITFRRDPTNFRPRINKLDSTKDRDQKAAGSYYYLDD